MTSRLLFIQVIGLFIGFCLNNAAAVPVLEDEIRASGFEIAKNMVFTTQSSVITTENSILFNQDSNEQVSENMQIQQIQQISTVSTISQHSDDIDNDDNAEISTNEPNIDNQHSDDIDDDDNAEISTNEPNIANQHSDKQILTDVHQSSEQPLKNNHHNDIVDNSKTFTTEPNTATALDSIEYKEEENPAVSTTDLHLPIAELRLPILKQNTLQQLNSAHLMQPILTSETVNRFVRFQLPSRAVKCQCFLSSSENGTSYLVDLFQTRRYNVELFIEQGVTRHCKAHCDVEGMNLFNGADLNLEYHVHKHNQNIGQIICNDNKILWSTIRLYYHVTVSSLIVPSLKPTLDKIGQTSVKSNYRLKCAWNTFVG